MALIKNTSASKPTIKGTTKKDGPKIGIKMVSTATENVISFQYLADTFSRAIFKCNAKEVEASQLVEQRDGTTKTAQEIIEELFTTDKITCIVTDMTIDKFAGISLDEY